MTIINTLNKKVRLENNNIIDKKLIADSLSVNLKKPRKAVFSFLCCKELRTKP